MVIDLRYNGGGRIRSANHLASQTGGDNTKDFIFARYRHNDKYTSWNTEDSFLDLMQSIDMNRVFVLTGPGTCSASELVINSLSPFLDVVVIGQTTCGKPIGMYGKEFCDKRIVPIEFQVLNHNNEGDYFDGITPSCTQLDDLSKLFGDPDEAMFAHAIHFMNNGQCLPVKQQNKMAQELPLVKQEVDFIPPEKENH